MTIVLFFGSCAIAVYIISLFFADRFVYRILPVFVFYTDRFMPDPHEGCARLCFIFVRPGKRGDTALLSHEIVHVKQFYRTFGIHGIRYRFSRQYRLCSEVEAYQEQLTYAPTGQRAMYAAVYASFIANRYDLTVTTEEAQKMLEVQ